MDKTSAKLMLLSIEQVKLLFSDEFILKSLFQRLETSQYDASQLKSFIESLETLPINTSIALSDILEILMPIKLHLAARYQSKQDEIPDGSLNNDNVYCWLCLFNVLNADIVACQQSADGAITAAIHNDGLQTKAQSGVIEKYREDRVYHPGKYEIVSFPIIRETIYSLKTVFTYLAQFNLLDEQNIRQLLLGGPKSMTHFMKAHGATDSQGCPYNSLGVFYSYSHSPLMPTSVIKTLTAHMLSSIRYLNLIDGKLERLHLQVQENANNRSLERTNAEKIKIIVTQWHNSIARVQTTKILLWQLNRGFFKKNNRSQLTPLIINDIAAYNRDKEVHSFTHALMVANDVKDGNTTRWLAEKNISLGNTPANAESRRLQR